MNGYNIVITTNNRMGRMVRRLKGKLTKNAGRENAIAKRSYGGGRS